MADDGKQPDLIKILHEGLEEARDQYVESVRALRSGVQRPMDPSARELKAPERKVAGAAFLADPTMALGKADEQAARFQLSPDVTPERVWREAQQAMREAE